MDAGIFRPGQVVAHASCQDEAVNYLVIKRVTEETEHRTDVYYLVREFVNGRPTRNTLRLDQSEVRRV